MKNIDKIRYSMTKREKEILEGIVEKGLFHHKDIGNYFNIADCTVKSHLIGIYTLTNSHSIAELIYKQLQQLKAKNEELKSEIIMMNNDHYHNVDILNRKYKQCLDEIEELIETCNNTMHCKDCKFSENCQYRNGWGWKEIVFRKIKQAKEGE